jgi:3-phenylpropionate/trans-cinnamate dioxygenase ferredoxin reductase subunit
MTLVVVGASIAGITAAETARTLGYSEKIVIVGQETHLPYDRPPLSKQVLRGEWGLERIALRQPATYTAAGLDLMLGREAIGLDLAAKDVLLDGGDRLAFDDVIIATGARPARLPFGHNLENVHVMRTIEDSERMRSVIVRGGPLVVIGAGFMGTEVAAAARKFDADVTVIDTLTEPLLRALGPWMGSQVRALHMSRGVHFRLSVGVTEFVVEQSRAVGVQLTDGTVVEADAILVAIGSKPNVEWLDGTGLDISVGLLCDQYSLVAQNVAAAGDVTARRDALSGEVVRLEHLTNAQEQAIAATTNLLAEPGLRIPFMSTPYFWSDQYDVKIQAYGVMPANSDVTLASGDVACGRFVVAYRQDGRLVGAVGWNSPRELVAVRAGITAARMAQ